MISKVVNNGQNLTLPEILDKHGHKESKFKFLKSVEKNTALALQIIPNTICGTGITTLFIGTFAAPAVVLSMYSEINFWTGLGLSLGLTFGSAGAVVGAITAIALTIFGINLAVRKSISQSNSFESFDLLQKNLIYLSEIGLHKDVITTIYDHKADFNEKKKGLQDKLEAIQVKKDQLYTNNKNLEKQINITNKDHLKKLEFDLKNRSITGSEFINRKSEIIAKTDKALHSQKINYHQDINDLDKDARDLHSNFKLYENSVLDDIKETFNSSLKSSYEEYQTLQLQKNPNAIPGVNYKSFEKFEKQEKEKYTFTSRSSHSDFFGNKQYNVSPTTWAFLTGGYGPHG